MFAEARDRLEVVFEAIEERDLNAIASNYDVGGAWTRARLLRRPIHGA